MNTIYNKSSKSASNNTIKQLSTSEFSKWDCYVKNHPQGSFFHLSGWKEVISKSFNHDCYFLYVEIDGKISGVLPLVEVKSKLFGHALISTPFCVYGGAIADTPELVRQLEQQACQLAEKLSVDYLELRYQEKQESSLLLKQAHSTFGFALAEDNEKILASIKKKQRAVIRHSLKNELSFSLEQGKSNLADFYQLLSTSYRNLGTPIFSKNYFDNLVDVFGDNIDIAVIKNKDNQLSSAVMNFYFNEQVLPYYGGGNDSARGLKSADYMYYQVMCNASEKGYRWYDFGRSKNDSGPYKYKKNWGMEPKSLYYYYHLVNATELPNLSPNNPKYKLFIQLWQKLPLKVSQLVGPFLSKFLG
ncbi:FemAB family XrtA/PEP-CTERM system-associated protein [Colwellia psychrerythraea]|uniref:FemAB-related protein, PEP-CTERM system-associated protein n=1 Tax=Colwellia psychrerythraea TaxID=28229 RepID=A0A099L1P9_COLPS|nr:FemAB family XrtA/PEP-CTERM system-associated protein [Colwellia psychrerythraea]KGJ96771.1 FemAB-related protein, PEP-CTERM system-associated protein [Colwellia psychrerythraea]